MVKGAIQELVKVQRQRLREAQKAFRDQLKSADCEFTSLRRESALIVLAY